MNDPIGRLESALAERYTIERELGSGGMATVYLAEDLKHHRKVAIKVLRPALAATIGTDRFLREIEIAASLTHPHILALYDSGESNGYLFYVMPYIEGQSLRDRLGNERQLPLEESLQIAREVADALDYAHSEGVIHRDIKPENIMLSRGHAVVADFGIARAVSVAGGERLTETGMTLGTPAYMSPEQATAEEVDGRSDIYSLGCVLYEMLGGDPPYVGSTPRSVLARKLADPVPSLRALRTVVSEDLQAVVEKALVREKVDRYKTADDFVKALADPSSVATPAATGFTDEAATERAKRMMGVLGGAAIAAVVALGVVRAIVTTGGPTIDHDRVAVLPFENRTGEESLDNVGRVAADHVTQGISLSGLMQVVPTVIVMQTGGTPAISENAFDPRAQAIGWAQEISAGTLVHGYYARNADSLTIHAQIFDAADGAVLHSIEPVSAATVDPMGGIDQLRQRVMGALAVRFDEDYLGGSPGLASATHIPSMNAYSSFMAGHELFAQARWDESIDLFNTAFEADSAFVQALYLAGVASINLGDYGLADSLTQIAEERRDQLAPLDRYGLDHLQGMLSGDHTRTRSAARQMAALAPNSGYHFQAGLEAIVSNLPHEALEVVNSIDPSRGLFRVWTGYWYVKTRAYHMLGDYRRELRSARMGLEQFAGGSGIGWLEIRALIALDRVDEALGRLNDVLALPPERGYAMDATKMLQITALELRVHGHGETASRLFHRAIDVLEDRSTEEMNTWEHRYAQAKAYYLSESWEEAAERFQALAVESPDRIDVQGYIGVLAARRGDAAEADRSSVWLRDLEAPFLLGRNTYWRARIAAQLGELEIAVRLLQASLSEGLRFSNPYEDMFVNAPYLTIHTEMDFEPLHDYAPFQELMRPKG